MSSKVSSRIYFIAGILYFVISIRDKNYTFIPLGCLFIILGAKYNKKNDDKNNNKDI